MATQHPDNAAAPYWETDGDGFVSVAEELTECISAYRDLGVDEYMWDWEGKYADEAVADRLFTEYYDFCRKAQIGKDTFLTFRVPNIWHEKGYSLLRALMVILTSEDFSSDLKFRHRPLFEVILPMTETAEQLMYIQRSFRKLAHFKHETFSHHVGGNIDYLEIIPLVESVSGQLEIGTLLNEYVRLHTKEFARKPVYIRPFLARSDPAMVSGLLATVLANKIALAELSVFSRTTGVKTYPIIGVGSLVFRGGLSPETVFEFVTQYPGVRTVTIQSAFRYDFALPKVKRAIALLKKLLPTTKAVTISTHDSGKLKKLISRSEALYQATLTGLIPSMRPVFAAVPRRRERRQHIGFLSYGRSMRGAALPRAINFTAAFYSLGIPPELIGAGRFLASLSPDEFALVQKYYVHLKQDFERVGRFFNRIVMNRLVKSNSAWKQVAEDVRLVEKILGIALGPKTQAERLHANLAEQLWIVRRDRHKAVELIAETGKLRKSLG